MQIICPECGFARELPEDKIPPTAQVATCPKCRHKFKFRELPQERPIHFGDEPEETPADSPSAPLPPHESSPPPQHEASTYESQKIDASGYESEEEEDDIYYPEADSGQDAMEAREVPTPDVEDDYEPSRDPDAIQGPPMTEGDIWNRLESMGDSPGSDSSGRFAGAGGSGDAGRTVPWEDLHRYGFFGGLAQTIRLAMFHAPSFFRQMKVGGGILRPMVFYLLLSEFYAVIQYMWDMLGLYTGQMMGDGSMDQPFGQMGTDPMGGLDSLGIAPALMLLVYPVIFAVMILLSAGLTHVFLNLFRASSSGFEGTFRGATYGSAPLVLAVIPVVGPMVSMLWSLTVTVIAYKNIHKTTYPRVIAAMGCMFVFALFLLVFAFTYVVGGFVPPN
ncbi:hypothetical protein DPQ33_12885 [Oceanidesulfovibrio indonesiensis]|uniref:Yip1 domain-containing protein n=1 Tax=Oceanidesulfovibrio indonesiensis TaxID=54767 RepID=A0A7M3MDM0_9BACT|nr:zinc-ribbon domain-containing protein [Oceanidesulfovibrio indonesiensis]TVM16212.1 hypothetical protein DPQ33_12885 [Oceanidesulfovibrio indonesiensis]